VGTRTRTYIRPAGRPASGAMIGAVDRPASVWLRAGLGIVFVWFLVGGIAHFAATETEMRIVPPWVPWPRAAVLVSGVFELLGAAGLLVPRTRRAAGIGLVLLTLAVTPAHIYMLQRPDLFGVPLWLLWLRLPVQAALVALIAWTTFPAPRRPKTDGARADAIDRSEV
jgi:uncharacterized membrane protein